MKKFWIICIAVVLIIAIAVPTILLLSKGTSGKANNTKYDQSVTSLDLSGQHNPDIEEIMGMKNLKELNLRGTHISIADYEKIQAALPNCKIQWSVLVGTVYQDDDSEEIDVFKFTEKDIDALKYLPLLKKVNAFSIVDEDGYKYLAKAQAQYPDIRISYKVPLGMAEIQSDCTGLKLKKVDVEELRNALQYLPNLKDVTFNGELPSVEEINKLQEDFPNVNFQW